MGQTFWTHYFRARTTHGLDGVLFCPAGDPHDLRARPTHGYQSVETEPPMEMAMDSGLVLRVRV